MTREKQKKRVDNTENDLRHWLVIRTAFGETRLYKMFLVAD